MPISQHPECENDGGLSLAFDVAGCNSDIIPGFAIRNVNCDYYMCKPSSQYEPDLIDDNVFVPVLRIFGSTIAGQKCCMHMHGVEPYFMIPSPSPSPQPQFLRDLSNSIDIALDTVNNEKYKTMNNRRRRHVHKIIPVLAIPFYGYNLGERLFLKILMFNPIDVKKAAEVLHSGSVSGAVFQPHEVHIPYILQFFLDFNLYGMDYIYLSAVKFRRPAEYENDQLTHSTSDPHLTLSQRRWNIDEIEEKFVSDLVKCSTCELEVDAMSSDILIYKTEGDASQIENPGLKFIWRDEEARTVHDMSDNVHLNIPSSPLRQMEPTESEMYFQQLFKEKMNDLVQPDAVQDPLPSPSSQTPTDEFNKTTLNFTQILDSMDDASDLSRTTHEVGDYVDEEEVAEEEEDNIHMNTTINAWTQQINDNCEEGELIIPKPSPTPTTTMLVSPNTSTNLDTVIRNHEVSHFAQRSPSISQQSHADLSLQACENISHEEVVGDFGLDDFDPRHTGFIAPQLVNTRLEHHTPQRTVYYAEKHGLPYMKSRKRIKKQKNMRWRKGKPRKKRKPGKEKVTQPCSSSMEPITFNPGLKTDSSIKFCLYGYHGGSVNIDPSWDVSKIGLESVVVEPLDKLIDTFKPKPYHKKIEELIRASTMAKKKSKSRTTYNLTACSRKLPVVNNLSESSTNAVESGCAKGLDEFCLCILGVMDAKAASKALARVEFVRPRKLNEDAAKDNDGYSVIPRETKPKLDFEPVNSDTKSVKSMVSNISKGEYKLNESENKSTQKSEGCPQSHSSNNESNNSEVINVSDFTFTGKCKRERPPRVKRKKGDQNRKEFEFPTVTEGSVANSHAAPFSSSDLESKAMVKDTLFPPASVAETLEEEEEEEEDQPQEKHGRKKKSFKPLIVRLSLKKKSTKSHLTRSGNPIKESPLLPIPDEPVLKETVSESSYFKSAPKINSNDLEIKDSYIVLEAVNLTSLPATTTQIANLDHGEQTTQIANLDHGEQTTQIANLDHGEQTTQIANLDHGEQSTQIANLDHGEQTTQIANLDHGEQTTQIANLDHGEQTTQIANLDHGEQTTQIANLDHGEQTTQIANLDHGEQTTQIANLDHGEQTTQIANLDHGEQTTQIANLDHGEQTTQIANLDHGEQVLNKRKRKNKRKKIKAHFAKRSGQLAACNDNEKIELETKNILLPEDVDVMNTLNDIINKVSFCSLEICEEEKEPEIDYDAFHLYLSSEPNSPQGLVMDVDRKIGPMDNMFFNPLDTTNHIEEVTQLSPPNINYQLTDDTIIAGNETPEYPEDDLHASVDAALNGLIYRVSPIHHTQIQEDFVKENHIQEDNNQIEKSISVVDLNEDEGNDLTLYGDDYYKKPSLFEASPGILSAAHELATLFSTEGSSTIINEPSTIEHIETENTVETGENAVTINDLSTINNQISSNFFNQSSDIFPLIPPQHADINSSFPESDPISADHQDLISDQTMHNFLSYNSSDPQIDGSHLISTNNLTMSSIMVNPQDCFPEISAANNTDAYPSQIDFEKSIDVDLFSDIDLSHLGELPDKEIDDLARDLRNSYQETKAGFGYSTLNTPQVNTLAEERGCIQQQYPACSHHHTYPHVEHSHQPTPRDTNNPCCNHVSIHHEGNTSNPFFRPNSNVCCIPVVSRKPYNRSCMYQAYNYNQGPHTIHHSPYYRHRHSSNPNPFVHELSLHIKHDIGEQKRMRTLNLLCSELGIDAYNNPTIFIDEDEFASISYNSMLDLPNTKKSVLEKIVMHLIEDQIPTVADSVEIIPSNPRPPPAQSSMIDGYSRTVTVPGMDDQLETSVATNLDPQNVLALVTNTLSSAAALDDAGSSTLQELITAIESGVQSFKDKLVGRGSYPNSPSVSSPCIDSSSGDVIGSPHPILPANARYKNRVYGETRGQSASSLYRKKNRDNSGKDHIPKKRGRPRKTFKEPISLEFNPPPMKMGEKELMRRVPREIMENSPSSTVVSSTTGHDEHLINPLPRDEASEAAANISSSSSPYNYDYMPAPMF